MGRNPNELTHELNPATVQQGWARYRELIMTDYVALIVDGDTVANNLIDGTVIKPSY